MKRQNRSAGKPSKISAWTTCGIIRRDCLRSAGSASSCPLTSTKQTGEPVLPYFYEIPFDDGEGPVQVRCDSGEPCRCPENFLCRNSGNTGHQILNIRKCPGGKQCPKGVAVPEAQLKLTPAGRYSPEGRGAKQCPAFHHCQAGSEAPIKCKTDGSELCEPESPAAKPCPPGYTCPNDPSKPTVYKEKCPAGQYCEEGKGMKECNEEGFWCPETSTSPKGVSVLLVIENLMFSEA